jgi:hypothetical protein
MSETSEDKEKLVAYLNIIQDRILAPIRKTEIQQYCTATLLLLFSAIDGLGKLLASDDCARPSKRIRGFLDYMGGDYKVCKDKLLKLRNSLVHNAINVEAFFSNTEISKDQHLKRIGSAGFIYVNTTIMYQDIVNAFERFQVDIQDNPILMRSAANRLKWIEDNPIYDPNSPTPPPPVEFINFDCKK